MTYAAVQTALNNLQDAIEVVNTKRGYDSRDNISYTLGYIQSMFSGIVASLPKSQQAKIMAEIRETTAHLSELTN